MPLSLPQYPGEIIPKSPSSLSEGTINDLGLSSILEALARIKQSGYPMGNQDLQNMMPGVFKPTFVPTTPKYGDILDFGTNTSTPSPVIAPVPTKPSEPMAPSLPIGEAPSEGGISGLMEGIPTGIGATIGENALPGMTATPTSPGFSLESMLGSMVPGLMSSIAQGELSPGLFTGPMTEFGTRFVGNPLGEKITSELGLPNAPAPGPGFAGLLSDVFGNIGKVGRNALNVGSMLASKTNPYAGLALPGLDFLSDLFKGYNVSQRVAQAPMTALSFGLGPTLSKVPGIGPVYSTLSSLVSKPLAGLIQAIALKTGLAKDYTPNFSSLMGSLSNLPDFGQVTNTPYTGNLNFGSMQSPSSLGTAFGEFQGMESLGQQRSLPTENRLGMNYGAMFGPEQLTGIPSFSQFQNPNVTLNYGLPERNRLNFNDLAQYGPDLSTLAGWAQHMTGMPAGIVAPDYEPGLTMEDAIAGLFGEPDFSSHEEGTFGEPDFSDSSDPGDSDPSDSGDHDPGGDREGGNDDGDTDGL